MASRRRQRRRGCNQKQRHLTSTEAYAHVQALVRCGRAHGFLHIYRCQFCDGYHVGHAKKS